MESQNKIATSAINAENIKLESTNNRPPTAIGFRNEIANVEGKEVKILKSKASEDILATINSIEMQQAAYADSNIQDIISSTHTLNQNPIQKESSGTFRILQSGDELTEDQFLGPVSPKQEEN